MSQAIEQLVDPPTLAQRLLHTSAELLGVSRGAVYLRQGDPPLYRLAGCLGPAAAADRAAARLPADRGACRGRPVRCRTAGPAPADAGPAAAALPGRRDRPGR